MVWQLVLKKKNMKFIEILNFFMHKFIVSHGVFDI